MRRPSSLPPILVLAGLSIALSAAFADDLMSDTWEAVDMLGRPTPAPAETGPPKADRTVGLFYFLWLGQHGQAGPYDITKILAANPNAMQEKDNPAWGAMYLPHHWGESLFGYYQSTEPWVQKKHARMLGDALVDVIIFDVTNKLTYKDSYTSLCKSFLEVRAQGSPTPQIAFLCPFWDPTTTARELWNDLYKPGLFKDLWFQWEGKPLLLADPAKVDAEFKDFFTFRKPEPSYFTGPSGPDQWGWLEVAPQHVFKNSRDEAEQMTVGVAQNAVAGRLGCLSEKNALGRSYHDGAWDTRPNAAWYGFNVTEQWRRVREVNPKFVFITGWNEWIAGRFDEFNGVKEPVMFVDEFNHENSRDIEPMRGGHGDTYYYQMISDIRKYKGARPQPAAGPAVTIDLAGGFDQWENVSPEYKNHRGGTEHRNFPGWGNAGVYTNDTGRNNITRCKVARNADNLYFYAETAETLTPATDPNWMRLYIDADGDYATGWEGFDFIVNRTAPKDGKATLEKCAGGWTWASAAEVPLRVEGNKLHLAIPRAVLECAGDKAVNLRFKWSDNIQKDGDPMEFTLNGDSAPPGRFMYRYRK